jgi:Ribbon-helix-helix protein, copG family
MLDPAHFAFLAGEAERTGLSRSELVRRALDATYRPERRRRVRGFDVGFGLWLDPDAAVAGRRAGSR